MSVLIRGMEMPKSCKSCDLLQNYDGDMFCPFNNYLNFGDIKNVPDYVLDACPLVELPLKHGRLVDCDKLIEKEEKEYLEQDKELPPTGIERLALALVHSIILSELNKENAPTIIEAEGVENNDG